MNPACSSTSMFFLTFVWVAGLAVYGLFLGLLFAGVDRVLVARLQHRIGPPLAQPFADVWKLFHKQDAVPGAAVPSLFRLMPVAALASALTLLLYVPLGGLENAPLLGGRGDAILVLYLLLLPGLAMVLDSIETISRCAPMEA